MLKKVEILWGYTNSEVGFFLGIKNELLSDPPSLKYMSGQGLVCIKL